MAKEKQILRVCWYFCGLYEWLGGICLMEYLFEIYFIGFVQLLKSSTGARNECKYRNDIRASGQKRFFLCIFVLESGQCIKL